MPWCADCARYYAPSAMTVEGHCPQCDADLLAPDPPPALGETTAADEKVPWHFKLMVVLLVLYLGWRFLELLTPWL